MQISGTHGTSASIAFEIMEYGFAQSNSGRSGPGVYLWASESTGVVLARMWFAMCVQLQKFSSKDECRVLRVSAEIEEDELLDFCDHRIKEKLISHLHKSYKLGRIKDLTMEETSLAVDTVVRELERKMGLVFKVLVDYTTFPNPKKGYWHGSQYPYKAFGNPAIYVIRNLECITKTEVTDHG